MVDYTLPALSVSPPDVWGGELVDAFAAFDGEVEAPRAVQALRSWRAGLANRWYTPARVVCVGSSTTFGTGATALDRRYVNRLGDLLHAWYNPPGVIGGAHIAAVDSGWTTTGTVGTNLLGLGLQSVTLAAGATMSRTVNPTTGFTVLFEQGPGAGQFTVSIDGGAATTVTPDTTGAANRHDGTWSSGVLAAGSHPLLITAVGACVISGVYAHSGDLTSGVQVYQSGRGGSTAADFSGTSIPTRIAQLGASLVPIMLGSNDYATNVNPDTFATNLAALINNTKAVAYPPPSFLLLGTYRRFDPPAGTLTYRWPDYLDAMRDLAAADPVHVAYADISAPYPASQSADVWDVIGGDGVHQTDRGYALMADLAAEAIRAPRLTGMRVSTPATAAPSSVSGLVSWFRADALALADNTAVSSWAPSGGAQTAPLTQTGTNRPTLRTNVINGLPAIRFAAASSQSLDSGAWSTSYPVPLTIFCVARFTSLAAFANLWSGRSGVYAYAGNTPSLIQIGAGAVGELSGRESTDTDWHVLAAVYNGTASTIHWDSRAFTARGTTGTGANAAMPGVRLGTNSTAGSNFLTGDIAEWALYSRALSAAEVGQVVAWIAAKYALEVA